MEVTGVLDKTHIDQVAGLQPDCNSLADPQILNKKLEYDLAITLLGRYPREQKIMSIQKLVPKHS